GISSELYPKAAKMKKQMTYANNKGVQFVIMVGEDEMKSGVLTIKNMESGEQKNLNITDLIQDLS
ncbi:MAG: His/Gly/Thr/Pro-type tRNA ligase C-terminal domain-containing protein, partial [Bacteroidota bacterium]|nr:His/Gly/Thr/Pro-type tRNA ligase C-terminal domain-containing protein [Bacteroidota bacterium]